MDLTFIISLSLWLLTLILDVLLLIQLAKLFKKLNNLKVITVAKQDVIDYDAECLVKKWSNTNLIRIKGSSVEVGNKSDDPNKYLYPNYLEACESLSLNPVPRNKFINSLMNILSQEKGVTHDKQKIRDQVVISNLKLKS